jgi:hypothetical protein
VICTYDSCLYNALVFVDAYMWWSDLNLNYICVVVSFECELYLWMHICAVVRFNIYIYIENAL